MLKLAFISIFKFMSPNINHIKTPLIMGLQKISLDIEMNFMNLTYFIWIHKKN
jgi:hypothetical protein